MAQVVAKFPPRSVDNHSFGIPDFEPLLNSHQAAQLLDIHHKTLQKLARRGEIHVNAEVGSAGRPVDIVWGHDWRAAACVLLPGVRQQAVSG